nr:glycoside hydrolase family 3 N-terminal domain-containing protein [Pseudomonas amygdali]
MNNLNQPITSTGRTLALSAFKQTLSLSLLTFSVMQANLALAAVTPATGNAVEARVSSILDNMNQSEKINFTRVDDGHMIPSLLKWGIKGTVAYDSSMGVHVNNATFGAQYPSQSALAATWSINRAKEFGLAIAYETRISGGQQMLSPGVNLYRTPYNGRSAEYVSGEDPFLGAVLAPAIVNGIQAQGIQASGKHYLANEQEANRQAVDIKVDERTLRELYLPGFESMVKNANVASIMCGFNKVNGDYACENHHLITEVLKGEWGYQGMVISDFNAIHDAFKGAWAGTDIDMPSGLQFTEAKLLPYLWSERPRT